MNDTNEFEEPMGEPAHMETPRMDAEPLTSLPDPADLPVPEDHDLDSPEADLLSRPVAASSSPMPAPMAVDPLYAPPPAESFQDRRRRAGPMMRRTMSSSWMKHKTGGATRTASLCATKKHHLQA